MNPRRNLRASRNATLDLIAERLDVELRKIRKRPSDVEAIHDARVAARRLLAAGELWASHVSPWAGVRDRLPRILKRLGHVRNLEGPARHRHARHRDSPDEHAPPSNDPRHHPSARPS